MISKNRGIVNDLAMYGRRGDDQMGHLTTGEVVLPRPIADDPNIKGVLQQRFAQKGLDYGRYEVGGSDDSRNPVTGAREFNVGGEPGNESFGGDNYGGGGDGGYNQAAVDAYGQSMQDAAAAEQAAAQAAAQQAQADSAIDALFSALGINKDAPAVDRGAFDQEMQAQEEASQSLWDSIKQSLGIGIPTNVIGIPTVPNPNTLPLGAAYPSSFPGAAVAKGASAIGTFLENLFDAIDPANAGKHSAGNPSADSNSDGYGASVLRFANDPSYGNIPALDPSRALNALYAALSGVNEYVAGRGFTGRGYETAATDKIYELFNALNGNSNVEAVLNADVGKNLATEALTNKETELRNAGIAKYNEAFPTNFASTVFNPDAFSKSLQDVLTQRYNVASAQGGTAASRGNLSSSGLEKFNLALGAQKPTAESRLSEVGSSVTTGYGNEAQKIGDRAYSAATGYKLGDTEFDPTSYKQEYDTYKQSLEPKYASDLNSALGVEQLFDPTGALQTAGMQQGMVSGSSPLLDAIANRQQGVERKRGVGVSGSGVF